MRGIGALIAVLALAACEKGGQPQPASTTGLLKLVIANATVVGYLYTPDKPYIVASFSNETLQWRSTESANPSAQGQIHVFTWPDRTCIGFEQKNASMPSRGPERYLVCEAVQSITYSNTNPRSQDFRLQSGTLFLQYDPPPGTGFTQLFYASQTK